MTAGYRLLRVIGRILPCLALLAWMPAARSACDIAAAGTTARVTVGQSGREMTVHLPAGFDPARPAPVLFLFHGSRNSGAEALRGSRLAETADRHGFIVAAPDGGIPADGGYVWNIPGVPSVTGRMPESGDPDDAAYVRQTIAWLEAKRCIDRTRIYATGISGGGRMASLMGCIAADRFAAIAPVVGLRAGNPLRTDPQRPDPASCRPTRPMPVITFAGDKDTTNPVLGGGGGYWQYPMSVAVARWAAFNHCRASLVRRDAARGTIEEVHNGCRAGADVVAWTTIGGGHVWLADNEVLWAFLSRFRRIG